MQFAPFSIISPQRRSEDQRVPPQTGRARARMSFRSPPAANQDHTPALWFVPQLYRQNVGIWSVHHRNLQLGIQMM